MFVVDTNVLVYAANEDSPFHPRCRGLVSDLRTNATSWFITWPILYEFLRVATHPRALRSPLTAVQAGGFIRALLDAPGLGILTPTERHADVLGSVIAEIPHLSGNLMHDAHTAVLMREHGIRRIYTRDTDFHRFPFVERIDPVS